jgi:hypothetical protein
MPRALAHSLLDSLPARAVLFVAGDNDTYPLWYAQQVEGVRQDVTVVTLPLLPAPWYPDEFDRRDHLVGPDRSGSDIAIAHRIAENAKSAGRPVAVALTVSQGERNHLSNNWKVIGMSAISDAGSTRPDNRIDTAKTVISVDRIATGRARDAIESWRAGRSAHQALDPVHEYFLRVLSCPGRALEPAPSNAQLDSLASLCNLW